LGGYVLIKKHSHDTKARLRAGTLALWRAGTKKKQGYPIAPARGEQVKQSDG